MKKLVTLSALCLLATVATSSALQYGDFTYTNNLDGIAVIPCGTGNDVAQNAGILSVADAAAALREGISHTFDLIRVDGPDAHRHAFLFANAGFSSIPTMQLWMKRLLGATGAYYLATFLQVLAYRAPHMTVRIDGQKHAGPTYLLIVGNAEWAAGGSMRICPGACTADGELNVVIIAPMSIFRIVTKLFSSIAKGTHIDLPEVDYFTGRKIEVYSDPPTLLDLDGDLFGTTPVVISVVPQAMELLVGNSRDYRRT